MIIAASKSGTCVGPICSGIVSFDWYFNNNILVNHPGAVPDDYYYLAIDDNDPRVFSVWNAATIEMIQNGANLDLRLYDYLIASSSAPSPTAVNAAVMVMATLPANSPDTEVTFKLGGGVAYVEPVANGQASHSYAFAAPGTYRIIVSSTHHGSVIVEVVVQ